MAVKSSENVLVWRFISYLRGGAFTAVIFDALTVLTKEQRTKRLEYSSLRDLLRKQKVILQDVTKNI